MKRKSLIAVLVDKVRKESLDETRLATLISYETRAAIIRSWSVCLERNTDAGTIWDVKCLPYDKDLILNAICEELKVTAADEIRQNLWLAALLLADYQHSVGESPLTMAGTSLSPDVLALLATDDGKREFGNKILSDEAEAERARYALYARMVENDREVIAAKLRTTNM